MYVCVFDNVCVCVVCTCVCMYMCEHLYEWVCVCVCQNCNIHLRIFMCRMSLCAYTCIALMYIYKLTYYVYTPVYISLHCVYSMYIHVRMFSKCIIKIQAHPFYRLVCIYACMFSIIHCMNKGLYVHICLYV